MLRIEGDGGHYAENRERTEGQKRRETKLKREMEDIMLRIERGQKRRETELKKGDGGHYTENRERTEA